MVPPDCDVDKELKSLEASVNQLSERIDVLNSLIQNIIKWLIIVVCIIALGRSAIDLGEQFFKGTM